VKQDVNQRIKDGGGDIAIISLARWREKRSSTRKAREWRPEISSRIGAALRTQTTGLDLSKDWTDVKMPGRFVLEV
jgi:hypothetical protein